MQKRVIRVGDEKQCAAHVLACEMKANGITGSAKEMSVPKITATTCMCTHDSVRGHTCTKTPQVTPPLSLFPVKENALRVR